MLRSFDSVALRQVGTRKLRAALTTFGIVLGVGMVFGVLVLVGTIRHTFDALLASAYGHTDLIVQGKAGTLPDSSIKTIRTEEGVNTVAPWIGATFTRLDSHGRAIRGGKGRMLVAAWDTSGPQPFDFRRVAGRRPRSGNELFVERGWARDRGVGLGDRIRVATPSGRSSLRIVGVFRLTSDLSFGGQGYATMPLPAARRLMQFPEGWIQATVISINRDQVDALKRRLESSLGPGVNVDTPTGAGSEIKQQLSAFNVVLYFFSGIALFVGAFLILNSFNMTVLQRMREIGTLRTLGATRAMVARTVLLGLALGLGLAKGLIAMIRALDFPVAQLVVPAGAVIAAVVVGMLVTLAGAFWPAHQAARVPPIQAVLGAGRGGGRPRAWRAIAGVALFLPGLLLGGNFWAGGGNTGSALSALAGVGATMAMFVGIALAAPFIVMPLVRALSLPLRRVAPTGGRLAADAARSNPLRTAATAAALTIGLSVVVTNSAMSASFLGTLKDQIDASFARDFTVQPIGASLEQGGMETVPPSLRRRIARMPETAVVTPIRSTVLELPGVKGAERTGVAIGYDPRAYGEVDRTKVRGATRARALRGVERGGVIVGASYAKAAGLRVGERVPLRGPRGVRRAPVVGVLDATTDVGVHQMQMSLATLRAVYGTRDDAQLAVRARSEADRPRLERRIDALVQRDYPNVELLSAADVKKDITDRVNQQFALFNAILAIAIAVSLLGVINTLAMSVIERTREIGVLRALGSSRWLVRATMLDESLLITLSGALAGIGLGTLIGAVWVSGLDSVMPGVSFRFPVLATVLVALAAVVLGVLAAILPARRAAHLNVIDALAYE